MQNEGELQRIQRQVEVESHPESRASKDERSKGGYPKNEEEKKLKP